VPEQRGPVKDDRVTGLRLAFDRRLHQEPLAISSHCVVLDFGADPPQEGDTIQGHGVEMRVEIQCVAEALDEGDGPAARLSAISSRVAALVRSKRA